MTTTLITTGFPQPRRPLFPAPYVVGMGILSGSSPNGLATDNGTPTVATIRVHLRAPGHPYDGYVVARTESASDGTWYIGNLDPSYRYDVIGRHAGYNDVVMSDVTPYTGFPRFTEADDTRITDSGDARVSE